jgi:hypothetical protein
MRSIWLNLIIFNRSGSHKFERSGVKKRHVSHQSQMERHDEHATSLMPTPISTPDASQPTLPVLYQLLWQRCGWTPPPATFLVPSPTQQSAAAHSCRRCSQTRHTILAVVAAADGAGLIHVSADGRRHLPGRIFRPQGLQPPGLHQSQENDFSFGLGIIQNSTEQAIDFVLI